MAITIKEYNELKASAKWEYKVVAPATGSYVQDFLCELGKYGWELVSVSGDIMYLKRVL